VDVEDVAGIDVFRVGVIDFSSDGQVVAGPGTARGDLVGVGLGPEGLAAGEFVPAAVDRLDLVGSREQRGGRGISTDPRQADEEVD